MEKGKIIKNGNVNLENLEFQGTKSFNEIKDKLFKKNDNEFKEILLQAKCNLYSLLLKLNEDEITENEIDIMYSISKDEQIKELFKK